MFMEGEGTRAKAGPIIWLYQVRAATANDAVAPLTFLGNAGLRSPNPLLYRCFPLTCARSQE